MDLVDFPIDVPKEERNNSFSSPFLDTALTYSMFFLPLLLNTLWPIFLCLSMLFNNKKLAWISYFVTVSSVRWITVVFNGMPSFYWTIPYVFFSSDYRLNWLRHCLSCSSDNTSRVNIYQWRENVPRKGRNSSYLLYSGRLRVSYDCSM